MEKKNKELIPMELTSENMRELMGSRLYMVRRYVLRKSQTKFAEQLGISLDRLCDFEAGKRITDPSIIYRIMVQLMANGVDIRLLFLYDFDVEYIKSKVDKKVKFKFNNEII